LKLPPLSEPTVGFLSSGELNPVAALAPAARPRAALPLDFDSAQEPELERESESALDRGHEPKIASEFELGSPLGPKPSSLDLALSERSNLDFEAMSALRSFLQLNLQFVQ
jgi:hypothetical protein